MDDDDIDRQVAALEKQRDRSDCVAAFCELCAQKERGFARSDAKLLESKRQKVDKDQLSFKRSKEIRRPNA